MLTEQASAFKVTNAVNTKTFTDTSDNGITFDAQGFNSVFFAVNVGANGGTLNAANKVKPKLQESVDGSDWTNVTNVGDAGGYAVDELGYFADVDTAGEAEKIYKVAYTGGKRYVRVSVVVIGTVSLPVSVTTFAGDGLKPQV